jgi:hypothetical protein
VLQDLNPELNEFSIPLLEEAEELRKILSTIITKSS